MILVILESPFAGDTQANLEYARRCMKDCLSRGESPFASHLLYTQDGVLDDTKPSERELGIAAGFAWGEKAEKRVFYVDHGVSGGMKMGAREAVRLGQPIEIRALDRDIDDCVSEKARRSLFAG